MRLILKNLFIPHHNNDFHPFLLRHHSLLTFSLVFLLANFIVFPALGIKTSSVSAAAFSHSELIQFANVERQKLGLNPLQEDNKLARAAQAKAQDMFKKQYWDHFGPNGESPWQFIKSNNYNYTHAGENLARNFFASKDVHTAWMNSPTHKSNIINPTFQDIGIAVLEGRFDGNESVLVVQMFGTKSQQPIIQTVSKPTQKVAQATILPTQSSPLSPPILKDTNSEIYTNQQHVTIEGEAQTGKTLKIYSNNKVVGELPRNQAAFTTDIPIEDGRNTIYARAFDGANSSSPSNQIQVIRDRESPDPLKITTEQVFTEKGLLISLASEEKLSKVVYQKDDAEIEFMQHNNVFRTELAITELSDLRLVLYDQAGNTSQYILELKQKELPIDEETQVLGTQNSQVTESLKDKIAQTSLYQRLNSGFVAFLMLIVGIDAAVVHFKGIRREMSSHTHFNLTILFIVMITSILG